MWQQQGKYTAEGKGRCRERQCGRFLKFLIIIAILFPPASQQVSKSLFVAHFYLCGLFPPFVLLTGGSQKERERERENT